MTTLPTRNAPLTEAATVRRVAVYGTLRYGEGNWQWALADQRHVGTGFVSGFLLYGQGAAFPYAVPSDELDAATVVDVFEAHDPADWPTVLAQLDMLEGYPVHYLRSIVHYRLDDGSTGEAWIYHPARPEDVTRRNCVIPSGDWFAEDADRNSWRRRPLSVLDDDDEWTADVDDEVMSWLADEFDDVTRCPECNTAVHGDASCFCQDDEF